MYIFDEHLHLSVSLVEFEETVRSDGRLLLSSTSSFRAPRPRQSLLLWRCLKAGGHFLKGSSSQWVFVTVFTDCMWGGRGELPLLIRRGSTESKGKFCSLHWSAPVVVHLCCRKPWVPSGLTGCRTVWLFDRESSEGSVELLLRPDLRSVLALSWGGSSGQALPSILLRASAYSASRWARDFTWGLGRLWFREEPSVPLLVGLFRIRIWGGGAVGCDSSWITIAVFRGDRVEPILDSFSLWAILSFSSNRLSISWS